MSSLLLLSLFIHDFLSTLFHSEQNCFPVLRTFQTDLFCSNPQSSLAIQNSCSIDYPFIMSPISTSSVNTKSFSMVSGGRVASILIPRSAYTIVTTMVNFEIAGVLVGGFKRPMYMSSITHRHFKNIIIRNTIIIAMVGGRIAGITRPIS